MARKLSSIAPDWWDYTTLDDDIIRDAAALTPEKMVKLSRPDRADGTIAVGRAPGQRSGPERQVRTFLGDGRVVFGRQGSPAHASTFVREGGPRNVLQSNSEGFGDAGRQPAFPESRYRRLSQDVVQRRSVRRHAGWAGRCEALGLQRSSQSHRKIQG